MAQNVTIAGASYSDVPAVQLPKTGGGTASFTDVTDTTAAAADVASGKYFYTAAGVLTQGTASGGGGGASNLATGTFKGTTTGAAMDVTLNYTGSGYPIAFVIYPDGGPYNQNATSGNAYTWYNLVQRYAIGVYCAIKNDPGAVPFQGTYHKGFTASIYKYSNSDPTSYQRASATNGDIWGGSSTNATSSNTSCAVLKSSTKMSVFIASTGSGFAANIDYRYWVIYSS